MSSEQSALERLEDRVAELEETVEASIQDKNGQRVSLRSLLDLGLTRRQALGAMGMVVSGATVSGAILKSIGSAEAQEGSNAITGIEQLGEETDRIGTIYAEDIDTDTFTQSTVEINTDSVITNMLNGADISDSADPERALETDGNGNLEPVAAVTDGDGTKREVWVIANGASDPAGADAEDLILEEES